jgi:hypothetical protein
MPPDQLDAKNNIETKTVVVSEGILAVNSRIFSSPGHTLLRPGILSCKPGGQPLLAAILADDCHFTRVLNAALACHLSRRQLSCRTLLGRTGFG